jgi:hypothetical protein
MRIISFEIFFLSFFSSHIIFTFTRNIFYTNMFCFVFNSLSFSLLFFCFVNVKTKLSF